MPQLIMNGWIYVAYNMNECMNALTCQIIWMNGWYDI
jgi:hypothetical protein